MKEQAGIALFVCLMILLVLSLLGISAMRMMTSQNMISSGSQGADIAFDAAETGLNSAILAAQTAASAATVSLPAVTPGGAAVETVYASDSKGIASIKVNVSVPADMGDAARVMVLEAMASAGAYGNGITPNSYRFSATSTVDALDIGTTHVQDTLIFTLKNQ